MCKFTNTGKAKVIKTTHGLEERTFKGHPQARMTTSFNPLKFSKVNVDLCLVDIIEDLNKNGHATVMSCCGHKLRNKKEDRCNFSFIACYTKNKKDIFNILKKYFGRRKYYTSINKLWAKYNEYKCIFFSWRNK
jgi:hypothetical protein